MQARYYDPVIGRFLSHDPVQFAANDPMQFNRYAYSSNNPANRIDPDGRDDCHNDAWNCMFGGGGGGSWFSSPTQDFTGAVERAANSMATDIYNSTPDIDLGAVGNSAWAGTKWAAGMAYELGASDGVQAVQQAWNGDFYGASISLVFFIYKPAKAVDMAGDLRKTGNGVVYKRINPETGRCYVGQCKNPQRFRQRQKEHDRELGVDHEFEILADKVHIDDLDYIEDTYIRETGLENLENKRHQMSEARRTNYEDNN